MFLVDGGGDIDLQCIIFPGPPDDWAGHQYNSFMFVAVCGFIDID